MDWGHIFSTSNRPANYQTLSIFMSVGNEILFFSMLFPASRFRNLTPLQQLKDL